MIFINKMGVGSHELTEGRKAKEFSSNTKDRLTTCSGFREKALPDEIFDFNSNSQANGAELNEKTPLKNNEELKSDFKLRWFCFGENKISRQK